MNRGCTSKGNTQIFTIAQQKGGVSKTATAQTLGALYAAEGRRVLLIDLDSQFSLTISAGVSSYQASSYEVIIGGAPVSEAAVKVSDNMDLIAGAGMLASVPNDPKVYGRLREALQGADYDVIVIDTPPNLGVMTLSALTAADYVIIPALADIFSLSAIRELNDTIGEVRRRSNPELKIAGVLFTRFMGYTNLGRDLAGVITADAAELGIHVFDARIRQSVVVAESQALQKSLLDYKPTAPVTLDYKQFFNELKEEVRA